jgi:hypothetical protein
VFTANIHSFFLILPSIRFIRYTTLFKSSDHHFWRYPMSWSGFNDTAVLHCALMSQLVSEHGPLLGAIQNTIVSNNP